MAGPRPKAVITCIVAAKSSALPFGVLALVPVPVVVVLVVGALPRY